MNNTVGSCEAVTGTDPAHVWLSVRNTLHCALFDLQSLFIRPAGTKSHYGVRFRLCVAFALSLFFGRGEDTQIAQVWTNECIDTQMLLLVYLVR